MDALKSANLALRFVLEMCALVAIGYWGFHATNSPALKWVLGLGAPLLVAVVWGLFAAPKSPVELSGGVKLVLGVVVLGTCAVAPAVARYPVLAGVFGISHRRQCGADANLEQ